MNAEHIVLLTAAIIGALGSVVASAIARAAHNKVKPFAADWAEDTTDRLRAIEEHINRLENTMTDHLRAANLRDERITRLEQRQRPGRNW